MRRRRFASGELMLEGEDKPLATGRLEPLSETQALLTVTEGRYHQVRRMFAAVGNHVTPCTATASGGSCCRTIFSPAPIRC